jgi:hypothetical protein
MDHHFEVLFRIIFVVALKFKSGKKFSIQEKSELLNGMYNLFVDFFSVHMSNDIELGSGGMDFPAHNHICLPSEPHNKNETEVHEVLQTSEICFTVSEVSERVRTQRQESDAQKHEKPRNSFPMARRGSQSSQLKTWKKVVRVR